MPIPFIQQKLLILRSLVKHSQARFAPAKQ
jgi:hypothetical protein